MKKLIFIAFMLIGIQLFGQETINRRLQGNVAFPDAVAAGAADSVAMLTSQFILKWTPRSALEQQLSLVGNNLTISGVGGNTVDLSAISGGGGIWGSITGTLSSQTDLQAALDAKQALLVSGTNIRTINGQDLLGAGDLVISGSGVTDHGLLTGLADDDHPQYHDDARALAWLSALYANLDTDGTNDVVIYSSSPSQDIEVAVGTGAALAALPAPTGSTVRLEFPTDAVENPTTDFYVTGASVAGTTNKTLTLTRNGAPNLTASWTDEGSGGGGDMLKATYDPGNNGIVDNAEALNGQPASFYLDNSDSQALTFTKPNLSISGGNSVNLSTLQRTEAEVDAFVANNGYLTAEVDGSTTNELQTISKVGSTVTLSNGGGSFTDADTQLTQEQVQDFVGLMVTGNTETGISVTYDDASDEFDFVVGGVTGSMIADFTIGGVDIQNESLDATKLAPNSVGTDELQDNAVTEPEIGASNAATAGTVLGYNGTALQWVTNAADGLGPDGDKGMITVGGGGTTLTIDTKAINSAQINDGAVGISELNTSFYNIGNGNSGLVLKGGTTGTYTVGSQFFRWTKIGRMVFFQVGLTSLNSGVPTGNLQLDISGTNMPQPLNNSQIFMVEMNATIGMAFYEVHAKPTNANKDVWEFYAQTALDADNTTPLVNVNFDGDDTLTISGQYETAE